MRKMPGSDTGASHAEELNRLMETINRLYLLFAELLEYPTPSLEKTAVECVGLLAATHPQAGEILAGFQSFIGQESLSRREEIYTNTFDLQSVCYPYVGYHLFGESYKRSWFMARLNQGYRENEFTVMGELPDHVTVILRFLARGVNDEFSQVLLAEGLVPAVKKMLQTFGEDSTNPYRLVLIALLTVLLDSTGLATPIESEKGGLVNA